MNTFEYFQHTKRIHTAALDAYEALHALPPAFVAPADLKKAALAVTIAHMQLTDAREANDAVLLASHLAYIPRAYRRSGQRSAV